MFTQCLKKYLYHVCRHIQIMFYTCLHNVYMVVVSGVGFGSVVGFGSDGAVVVTITAT